MKLANDSPTDSESLCSREIDVSALDDSVLEPCFPARKKGEKMEREERKASIFLARSRVFPVRLQGCPVSNNDRDTFGHFSRAG